MADPDPSQYNDFAQLYRDVVEVGTPCAEVERPAVLKMLGPIDGAEILDAACGSGPLIAALSRSGARVCGFDGSPAMVELARERLGNEPDLRVHDLSSPLPYGDRSFDAVVCSLAIHYVRHWTPVLREFRRVIRAEGRVLLSTHHPFRVIDGAAGLYLETTRIDDVWDLNGTPVPISYWRRPFQSMASAAQRAGLMIRRLSELDIGGSGQPHFLLLLLHPDVEAGDAATGSEVET